MGSVGQPFRQGPGLMASLFCDVWGFSWKTQRPEWSWQVTAEVAWSHGWVRSTWVSSQGCSIIHGTWLRLPPEQVIQEVVWEVMMPLSSN